MIFAERPIPARGSAFHPVPIVQHVCHGADVKHRLQRLFGENIIDLSDDCSVGPLGDVEAATPRLRMRFWQRLRASLDVAPEIRMACEPAFEQDLRRLMQLGAGVDEVVVWSGNNATEETFKRRVNWWLIEKCAKVTDAQVLDSARPGEILWVGSLSDRELKLAYQARCTLTATARLKLADDWEQLRRYGRGLRTLDCTRLVDRPMWHHDEEIVSALRTGPIPLRHFISLLMVATQQCSAFCVWRISLLCRRGQVSVEEGLCYKGRR